MVKIIITLIAKVSRGEVNMYEDCYDPDVDGLQIGVYTWQ